MSKISALTEWLGIRDLDAALPLALLSGAIVLCWTLPAALIPVEALRHLGNAQKVSVLFFVWGLIGILGAMLIPLIVHRLGRRNVFIIGVVSVLSGSVMLALQSLTLLIVGSALRILGFLCVEIMLEIIVMERIPRHRLARFEAVRMFALGCGLIVGPWLGAAMASRLAFWSPFALLVAVMALVGLYTLYFRLASNLEAPGNSSQAPNPLRFIGRFCQQPRLRLAWLLALTRSSWWIMFFIYSPIYCVQAGLGAEFAGAILSIGSAAVLLTPLYGKIGARIGVRPLLAVGYGFTGVATILVGVFASTTWAGIGFLLTAAAGVGIIEAVGNALFLRAARARERAEMTAVFMTFREVATLGPPGIFAVMLNVFALPAVFAVSGASMVLMVFFTRYIPKKFL
jgi:MFS family permease